MNRGIVWQLLSVWAGLANLVFVVVYWTLAPWWKSPIGRNLMIMAMSLTVAFFVISLSAFFGPFPEQVWWAVFASIGFTLTQRTVILIQTHRKNQRIH